MTESGKAPPWFPEFQQAYREAFGLELLYADPEGRILSGTLYPSACDCMGHSDQRRKEAAEQTLYWGETIINLCCDNGYAMWAVPIMHNNAITGILVVQGIDLESKETNDMSISSAPVTPFSNGHAGTTGSPRRRSGFPASGPKRRSTAFTRSSSPRIFPATISAASTCGRNRNS
mgnify:CR=1 FL=1